MVYGVGYLGDGKYKSRQNGITTRQYECWKSMLRRCYSKNTHKRQKTYINCTVAEEWHNFQNFAKWYDENYYEIKGHKMQLDKDIIVKGSNIYSPETCVFVPRSINMMFTKADKARNELPIGVCVFTDSKKYLAKCSDGSGRGKHLGLFDNPEEAFMAYKEYKEYVICDVAEKYRDLIPIRLYNALINYKVEIND